MLRWFVIVAFCVLHGSAGAQSLDFVIANFSNAELELFEVRNGRHEIIARVGSGHPVGRKSTAGTVWGIRWLMGREVCKFVTRERMTIVTVDAPAMPAGWVSEPSAGFEIVLSPALLRDGRSSARARQFMDYRLGDLTRLLPPAALQHLRRVRWWLDLDPTPTSGAFYVTWPSIRQAKSGRDYAGFHGAMYEGVVVPNIVHAIERSQGATPRMVLHELAHAYHHQVLGGGQPEIKRAYESAKAKGLYLKVSFKNGAIAPVGYAMTNEWEYFAVLTEAYFGHSIQAPFDAEELKTYDADGFSLVERAWNGALDSIAPAKRVACRSPA